MYEENWQVHSQDVNWALIKEFPEFHEQFPQYYIDDDDFELPYIVASGFVRFLIDSYNNGNKEIYVKGLHFIEKLHLSEYYSVQNLATVGFLESFPSDWDSSDFGKESKKWFEEVNRFWTGKVKYIGESFK